MRRNIIIGLLLIAFGIAYSGCSNSKSLRETNLDKMPEWFIKVPSDPDFLFAAKTDTSNDRQRAWNKALERATAEIAWQVNLKMALIERDIKEEVGATDTSQLTQPSPHGFRLFYSQRLTDLKVKEQKIVKEDGGYRAYVLVQYPIGAVAEAIMKKMSKQKVLYRQFRATKTFEELSKQIEKYEQWKKEQGNQ